MPTITLLAALAMATTPPAVRPPTPATGRCGTAAAPARAALSRARTALARTDIRAANREADSGLTMLGDAYAGPDLLDDTGMRLTLAITRERREPRAAAAAKIGVLDERLALCARPRTPPAKG